MKNVSLDKLLRVIERFKTSLTLPAREDQPLVIFEPGHGPVAMPFTIDDIPQGAKFGPRLFAECDNAAIQGQPTDIHAVRTLDWMINNISRKFNTSALPPSTIERLSRHAADLAEPLVRIKARSLSADFATATPKKNLQFIHCFQKDGIQQKQTVLTIALQR